MMVDQGGRVFGRWNIVDLAVVSGIAALALLTLVGYLLFRVPAVPEVEAVEPGIVAAGDDVRVVLRGRDFLPFFRVFLEPRAGADMVSQQLQPEEPSDEFTLSNRAQVRFVVESPTLAEVWIPDGIQPGVYDIGIYDETRRVAVAPGAVTITPASVPPPPSSATILVAGAFRGFTPEAARQLREGMRLPAEEGGVPWAEIVTLHEPVADEMRLQVGGEFVDGAVADRVQVPATLRITCVPFDGRCRAGETYLGAPSVLPIPFDGRPAQFFVEYIEPDVPGGPVTASVRARFVVPAEVAALVRAGDLDEQSRMPGRIHRPAAQIARVGSRRAADSGELALRDGSLQQMAGGRMVAVDVELSVPARATSSGISYRGQEMKAGKALAFATTDYAMSGWVLDISVPGPEQAEVRR